MEGKYNTIARTGLLKAITLDCVRCSARMTIHVDRKRAVPETILWECFDCQKADKEIATRMVPAVSAVNTHPGRVVAGKEKL